MFAKKHHILAIVLVPLIWAGSKPANSEEAQVPPSIPFSIYTDEFDDDSGIDQSGKTNIISEDGYIKFAPPGAMGEIDPQTSLGQGLIGLWHLNGNTRDASGNGHDGELGGAASCDAAGIYNEGCRFTGAGDYIDIADSADIAEGEAISVSLWMKQSDSAQMTLVTKNRSGFLQWDISRNRFNRMVFSLKNADGEVATALSDGAFATDGDWHHVVGVYDGGSLHIYGDGVALDSTPPQLSGAIFDHKSDICVGSRWVGHTCENYYSFNIGDIDELAIWDRALSAAEIQQLFCAAQPTEGRFQSITIDAGQDLYSLTGSWQETGSGTAVEVSFDGGASWYALANGETLAQASFSEMPVASFLYRTILSDASDLDSITFSWTTTPPPTYSDDFNDEGGIDQSSKTNISTEDGYVRFAPPETIGEIDPQSGLGQGLIGLWHLNGNTQDASGNGHDGELGGAASCDATGRFNQGCIFTGAGDYIDIADSSDIAEGEAISVSFWMKQSDSAQMTLVTKNRSGFLQWDISRNRFNQMVFTLKNVDGEVATALSDGAFATDGDWHHVVGVYDGSSIQIYGDGVALDSTPPQLSGAIFDYNHDMCVGSRWVGHSCENYYNFNIGSIDELAIWERALTTAEIQGLYGEAQPSEGRFQSMLIDAGQDLYSLTGSWQETGSGTAVEVSFDGGSNWYALGNGETLTQSSGPELPAASFVYRVTLTAASDLESITFSWTTTAPPAYTVTSDEQNCSVAVSPDKQSYLEGETVTLTAHPNTGYIFEQWRGDIEGTENPITLTIDADMSVNAICTLKTYTISLFASNGTITKTPDTQRYNYGDEVVIQATPAEGYFFSFWRGDGVGSANPLTVAVQEDISITAIFNDYQEPNPGDTFSFMFMGDDNLNRGYRAIRHAYTNYPDVEIVFSIPDNGWTSRAATYARYVNEWLKNPAADPDHHPIFMGVGNHDVEYPDVIEHAVTVEGRLLTSSLPGMRNFRDGPFDVYPNGFEEKNLNYSFDYKNAHFIMLNGYYHDLLLDPELVCGNDCSTNRFDENYVPQACLSQDLLDFVEESLSNTQATHKFVFFHEGAYPVPGGRHNGDSFDNDQCPGNNSEVAGQDWLRPMRDTFWNLLTGHDVSATFVGHSHHFAVTWARDPYQQYGALYEIGPGWTANFAAINIHGESATLRSYAYDSYTETFSEVMTPLIISKAPDGNNYPPQLYLHDGGSEKGYPIVTKRAFNLEVGQKIKDKFYFEAKDDNIDDTLTFSVENLPSFLQVGDESAQFRRINLTTKQAITEQDVGDHSFEVVVSDGQQEDGITINLTVLPAEKPVVLGATIENGATLQKVRHIFFLSRDNSAISSGRFYSRVSFSYNGTPVSLGGDPIGPEVGWHGYKAVQFTEDFLGERFELRQQELLPGRYDITMYSRDLAGNESEEYNLTFYYEDDGLDPSDTTPWVDSIYPFTGSTVAELSRIAVWIHSFVGTNDNLLENTTVSVTKDGREFSAYSIVNPREAPGVWGSFDIIFNNPVPDGLYEITVNPITERTYLNYVYGDPKTFSIRVASDAVPTRTIYVDGSLVQATTTYDPPTQSPTTGTFIAYPSIADANQMVESGDTVVIRGGTYPETIRPHSSGTKTRPISYRSYLNETVTLTGASLRNLPEGEYADYEWDKYGIYLWGKSYIAVEGIFFDNLTSGWARIVNSNFITLDGNSFTRALAAGARGGIKLVNSHDNKIVNNYIEDGNDNLLLIKCDRNLIKANTIKKGRHSVWSIKGGSYNVIRGNYFENVDQKIGEILDANDPQYGEDENHFGIFLTDAAHHNLIENNTFAHTRDTDGLASYNAIQYAGQRGIIRNNVFYDNLGGGLGMTIYDLEAEYNYGNRVYNNTFYNNKHGGIIYTYYSGGGAGCWSDNVHVNNSFYKNFDNAQIHLAIWRAACLGGIAFEHNSIFKDSLGDDVVFYTGASKGDLRDAGSLSYWEAGYPHLFSDNLEVDPLFVDAGNHDFHLLESSPLIDGGTFLTQTVSSGSGVHIPVADAAYFFDGFEMDGQVGDIIQLQAGASRARIIDIDYDNNIITVDTALSWQDQQGIGLHYNGSAPDIGAYEF